MTTTDAAEASGAPPAVESDAGSPPSPAPRRGRPVDPRLLAYSRASRGFFVLSAAVTVVQTAVIVGFAWVLTRVLVGAIQGGSVASLVPLLGVAAGLVVLRGALIAVAERVSAAGAAKASLQLRAALVAAVQRLGPGWLARRSAAALTVTAGHGLEALDAYFGRYLPQLVATAITMPIVVLAILVADPTSGLIVVLTMPLIPIFMVLIGLATRGVQRRQFDTLRQLAARFADTVEGLGTLKIFGRQHRAADSIEKVTRDYKRETMTVLRVSFVSGFALEFLASISVAIVAVTIGLRLLGGELGLFAGLFVLLLAPEAYLPVRQVGVQFHAAAEGMAATDEIFAVLDAAAAVPARSEADATDAADAVGAAATPSMAPAPADAAEPVLEARRLRPLHTASRARLRPVDLAVRRGDVVLLEGPSGAGKSSVVAALLGFVPHDGELRAGGRPCPHARELIAWAGQRPGLIAGTVAENVTLGDDSPDPSLTARCLTDAQASDIPPALMLGAGGGGLSGGQAQRVAVARALYRLRSGRAAVLVLDEPTSALDAATEARVWQTVRRTADDGAAVLLVSHRTTARAIADRVVRLDPPARKPAAPPVPVAAPAPVPVAAPAGGDTE